MAIFSSLISAVSAGLGGLGGAATAAGTAGAAGAGATGISGLAGLVGTAATVGGTLMQAGAAKDAAAEQKRQESIREVQMQVDANRQRRQIIRQSMVARAEALSTSTAQGAGSSSGLAGGLAQNTAESGQGVLGVNQALESGSAIFASNRRLADAQTRQSMGAGISSLGGALVSSAPQIGRLGAYSIG